MVIMHNMASMNAQRQYNIVTGRKSKASEKLASGYRINRAADDAAGLSISEKLRWQARGLHQASDNSKTGVSVCQIADGALAEVSDMLHRMTELSIQSANDTNTESDRQHIQAEINQLIMQIDDISDKTSFNTMKIFTGDGNANDPLNLWIQSGAKEMEGMYIEIDKMNTEILGIKDADVSTRDGAEEAIGLIQDALEKVSSNRSKIGAQQNRLEYTIANDDNTAENTEAAESRIRDTDMAEEMVNFSKENILQQAGQAMMAQANQSTQGIVTLLGQ